jgi:hypothetical protein
MLAKHSLFRRRSTWIAVLTCIALTAIFWGNLFRFRPAMIDNVYDAASDGVVIGRMARAAANGLFTQTDLGFNVDPNHIISISAEWYDLQLRFYEHPELIDGMGLGWSNYPSTFALQGYVLSALDLVNPLPRRLRIGFYHLLLSAFAAGMLVRIASILRVRFGWPAFSGFLVPVAVEPMFSALAPSLYWVIGLWYVPMALAMLLADEDEPRRNAGLVAGIFLAFLANFLCGYQFVSTIILAAATGTLLGVKERPNALRHVLWNASRVIGLGIAAFAVAVLMHAAKQGGFAVFLEKAANRMQGNASSLDEELLLGKFASIGGVIWSYLGGNHVTIIKNFGLLFVLLAGYAILMLLDERFNWFYGAGRRKLQTLALAMLASFVAPLSWLVLAKGHSFDHLPIDLIIWYVPTIPLGFAMLATAGSDFREYQRLKRGDAALSWLVACIPLLFVGALVALRQIDRRIETTGTWAITEHAGGVPIFESDSLGIELRMTNQWFTVSYPCREDPQDTMFDIHAEQDGATVDYSFPVNTNQVFAHKGKCLAARGKSDRPVSRIHFGETSRQSTVWQRDAAISLPDTFKPAHFTDADWDRGVNRTAAELLMIGEDFGRLLIKTGDEVLISPTDQRMVTSILSFGTSKVVKLDGAPIHPPEGQTPSFGIIRK